MVISHIHGELQSKAIKTKLNQPICGKKNTKIINIVKICFFCCKCVAKGAETWRIAS
jgi:hypothetical protein